MNAKNLLLLIAALSLCGCDPMERRDHTAVVIRKNYEDGDGWYLYIHEDGRKFSYSLQVSREKWDSVKDGDTITWITP